MPPGPARTQPLPLIISEAALARCAAWGPVRMDPIISVAGTEITWQSATRGANLLHLPFVSSYRK